MGDVLGDIGANMNAVSKSGETPAHLAVSHDKMETLRVLGELGADMNAARKNGEIPAIEAGETPAHVASRTGNASALLLLSSLGADMDAAKSDGETPAHVACRVGTVKCLCMYANKCVRTGLLPASAAVSFPLEYGDTLAHFAARHDKVDALRFLGELEADMDATNDYGNTPAQVAIIHDQVESLRVLGEIAERRAHIESFMKRRLLLIKWPIPRALVVNKIFPFEDRWSATQWRKLRG